VFPLRPPAALFVEDHAGARAPMAFMDFGRVDALNSAVYSVKIFGIPGFKSSLTIVHDFFGIFRVTSMLTKHIELPKK
jgi:hypothetical protein